MAKKMALLACLAFSVVLGCSTTKTTATANGPRAATPDRPHQAEAPTAAPAPAPKQRKFSLSLAEGWRNVPPAALGAPAQVDGAFIQPERKALILLDLYKNRGHTPAQEAEATSKMIFDGAKISPITTSADGKRASFTWSKATPKGQKPDGSPNRGKVVVLSLPEDQYVELIGFWTAQTDKDCAKDMDAMADSATME